MSNALLLQFDKHDLVGLGEWHNSREDQDIRISLLRNPRFPAKVRNIVVECGNAFYQETLDRFIAGEDVLEKDVQHVWRDTTQSPVAVDSPACEAFLNEVRSINLKLPKLFGCAFLQATRPSTGRRSIAPRSFKSCSEAEISSPPSW
jgi:hypothetical protein